MNDPPPPPPPSFSPISRSITSVLSLFISPYLLLSHLRLPLSSLFSFPLSISSLLSLSLSLYLISSLPPCPLSLYLAFSPSCLLPTHLPPSSPLPLIAESIERAASRQEVIGSIPAPIAPFPTVWAGVSMGIQVAMVPSLHVKEVSVSIHNPFAFPLQFIFISAINGQNETKVFIIILALTGFCRANTHCVNTIAT